MSQDSKISVSLESSKLAAARSKLSGIRGDLAEVLVVSLTAEERQNMLKMGDKTLAFVGKALEFARQNPQLVPSYLDLAEAEKDYDLALSLSEVLKDISTLQRGLEDTAMLSGGEAYNAALIFYTSVRGASRSNLPGTQAVYDELKKCFPGRPKK